MQYVKIKVTRRKFFINNSPNSEIQLEEKTTKKGNIGDNGKRKK